MGGMGMCCMTRCNGLAGGRGGRAAPRRRRWQCHAADDVPKYAVRAWRRRRNGIRRGVVGPMTLAAGPEGGSRSLSARPYLQPVPQQLYAKDRGVPYGTRRTVISAI